MRMIIPLSPGDAARFRDVCRAAEYTSTRLREVLGTAIPPPPYHAQTNDFVASVDAATPFNGLAALFFLGRPVDGGEMSELLPSGFINLCVDCGLLEWDVNLLRPQALVVPFGELLFASDLMHTGPEGDRAYVPTLSNPAMHLISCAVRRPVRSMLDLCGGCALHGIIASEFSESVVSSDLNPRAKTFVEFNCSLNSINNLQAVTGDLFTPVLGRRFDLILCNPPFVISPSETDTFCDNAFELDGLLRDLICNAPQHLELDGFFQTTCEWVEVRGQDWRDRLGDWLRDNGCDAWVLHANRQLPKSYAARRLRERTDVPEQLAASQIAWEQYFHDREVEMIHGGLIFLRRRDGANWLDVTELSSGINESIGESIVAGFAGRDLLFSADTVEALLSCCLKVAPGLHQEEISHWEDGGWRLDSIALRVVQGLPVTIGVDCHVRDLIGLFDGELATEQVLRKFAANFGMPVAEAISQATPMLHQLVRNGILVCV